jgi:hypothetical protein
MVPVTMVRPGESLEVFRSYCLSDTSQSMGVMIQRWFEDGMIIRLPDMLLTDDAKGCPETESFPLTIPWQLRPGIVTLKAKLITQVNPIRTAVQPLPDISVRISEDFDGEKDPVQDSR